MNFSSNPKRKPGKNRPASSRRSIQDLSSETSPKNLLKFFQGASKLICARDLLENVKSTKQGTKQGMLWVDRLRNRRSQAILVRNFLAKNGIRRKKEEPSHRQATARPTSRGFCTADSSEPAPLPRPWIFAPGATPARMASRYLCPCIAVKRQGKNNYCPR